MPSKATKKRRQQKQAAKKNEPVVRTAGQESTGLDQPSTSQHQLGMQPDLELRSEIKSIEASFQEKSSIKEKDTKMKLVPKPPPTKDGKLVNLICNHFRLRISLSSIYHYDVEIKKIEKSKDSADEKKKLKEFHKESAIFTETEENIEIILKSGKAIVGKYRCFNTKINRKVVDKYSLKENSPFRNNCYVFDGNKNIYTVRPLHIKGYDWDIITYQDDLDRLTDYILVIKPAQKEDGSNLINMEFINAYYENKVNDIPQECSMALETILRHEPAKNFFPVGRSFFPLQKGGLTEYLPGGRLLEFGFHQNCIMTLGGPVLNVDMSSTTFFKPHNLIEFLSEVLEMIKIEKKLRYMETNPAKIRCLEPDVINRLKQELEGARIYATHFEPRRKFRVHDISNGSADEISFECEGRRVSITEYFYRTYQKRLWYGRLPCVKINRNRDIFLPLEVCELPEEEHSRRKPGPLHTSEIIKMTAKPPRERFCYIEQQVCQLNQNFSTELNNFGIQINGRPVEFSGRIIHPPHIKYSIKSEFPKNGQWNLVGKKFLESKAIRSWSVLNFSSPHIRPNLQRFCRLFSNTATKFGLDICGVPNEIIDCDNQQNLRKLLDQVKAYDLVIVILTSERDKRYDKIKYYAEVEIGVVTQCVVSSKLNNCNEQFCANLCQKINTKLGGVNTSIDSDELPDLLRDSQRIMVIGADCNHPGRHELKYSVAAAVCNIDSRMSSYAATWSVQKVDKKKDIILKFKEMSTKLLTIYQEKNGFLPKMIIYFRDGVSEGEFEQVLDKEVKGLREAVNEFRTGHPPLISCIVVNKSHHTRFMVKDSSDNVSPGTKADDIVVHYRNFDFYLCSQKGLKGTSRPAHYTVLCDDQDYFYNNPQLLQKFIYFLCYVCARCTRSISIPVPVYYAHLCAYRVKKYSLALKEIYNLDTEDKVVKRVNELNVVPQLTTRMFFV